MPAHAPDPDRITRIYAKAERQQQGDKRMKVTYRGRMYRLSESDLGPGDDLICRAQTGAYVGGEGFALTGLMARLSNGDVTRVGTDVLLLVVWFARRKNGEPNLTFTEVLNDSGSSAELMRDLKMEVEWEEPDATGEGPRGESPQPGGQSSPSDSGSISATS